jgi:hypothetical protein
MRLPYDETKPLVARKEFRGGGRIYKSGDKFDPKHMALSERRIKVLFEQGFLMHPDEKVEAKSPPKPLPQPPKEKSRFG